MVAATALPLPDRAAIWAVVTAAAQPHIIQRQVVITQTITNADTVFTTVLTLGHGGSSTDSPAAPAVPASGGTSSSGGLTPEQIGIIVGCCVGAVVLATIALCCLTVMRRKRAAQLRSEYQDGFSTSYISMEEEIRRPSAAAQWSQYHRVRPPWPPRYTAVPINTRTWTASAQASTQHRR